MSVAEVAAGGRSLVSTVDDVMSENNVMLCGRRTHEDVCVGNHNCIES